MRRFVVLEHRWDGVHWDLMFEDGDVLRTWAIDVPIAAGVELPARALGDHRRIYLDYEGEISGGRGSVRRFDRGFYEPLLWTPERVRVEPGGRSTRRARRSFAARGPGRSRSPWPSPGGSVWETSSEAPCAWEASVSGRPPGHGSTCPPSGSDRCGSGASRDARRRAPNRAHSGRWPPGASHRDATGCRARAGAHAG